MSIRVILAPVLNGIASTAGATSLRAAFTLASEFGAHVEGLHVRADPRAAIPYIGEGMTADVIQELCDAAEHDGLERAARAEAVFEEERQRTGLARVEGGQAGPAPSAGWSATVGETVQVVSSRARTVDLSVIGRPGDIAGDGARNLFEGLLFRSGRPLLVVPGDREFTTPERIAIAWNGSPEAARAVACALPFLTRAKQVTIVSVGTLAEGLPDADALAQYLHWHGAKAMPTGAGEANEDDGQALLGAARSADANLIVMGAYTHSRWREIILGGVTRYMLENTSLPLFMVH